LENIPLTHMNVYDLKITVRHSQQWSWGNKKQSFFQIWFKNNGIFEDKMFILVLLLTTSVDFFSPSFQLLSLSW